MRVITRLCLRACVFEGGIKQKRSKQGDAKTKTKGGISKGAGEKRAAEYKMIG